MDSSHKFLKVLSGKGPHGLQGKNFSSQMKLGWLEPFSVFSFPWDPAWPPFLVSVQGPDHP